jgi:hypothetical protein
MTAKPRRADVHYAIAEQLMDKNNRADPPPSGTDWMTMDHPAVKAMREINPGFMAAAMRLGTPAALEGLGNLLVMNLAVFYGEKVAMATLRDIAANAAPVAHMWGALAASEDHEPGHA